MEIAGSFSTSPSAVAALTPVKCNVEYSSIEAWPADSTKRSRFGHTGFAGSYRKYFCQSSYTAGAKPIGAPGCPEFACCTPSIESVRIVLTHNWSMFCWLTTALCWLTLAPVRVGGLPQESQDLDAPGIRTG